MSIFKALLPIIIIILLFIFKPLLGVLGIIIYIAYSLFKARSNVCKYIGSMKYSKGDIDNALVWLKRACDAGNPTARTKISYAYLLLKAGKLDESEKVFTDLYKTSLIPEDKNLAKSNEALLIWKKGNLEEAVSMLEEIIVDYKTTAVYGSLGYLLTLKGDLEKALEFNLMAYDYNNSNSIIQDNLGYTYYLMEEYEKAEEIYKKLLEKNPTFPEVYYNYGLLLLKKGNPEKALEFMEKSLNYKLTFLSTVAREEIDAKIEETKALI